MSGNVFDVDITASDKTAKGIGSAEKRLGGLGKKAGRGAALESERGLSRLSRSLGSAEKAASRMLGGGALGDAAGKLVGVGRAGVTAAAGLGEAASSALPLLSVAGSLVVGLGSVVVAAAAAGAAAFKFIEPWVNGGAALGRLSQSIGVSIADLQQLQGAAERFGVNKDAMSGAVGGIGDAVHGAINGTNNEALSLLIKEGIELKRGPDGRYDQNQDIVAITKALADKVKGQNNPWSQKTIARIMGAEAALPLLRQGSAAISADMVDFHKHGAERSSQDVEDVTRLARKGVMARQLVERGMQEAQGGLARAAEPVVDGALKGGQDLADGKTPAAVRAGLDSARATIGKIAQAVGDAVKPAGQLVRQGGEHIERGAGRIEHAAVKLGESLLAFVERHEGVKTHAYQDSGGVWTIGVGHTGKDVHAGAVWNKGQVDHALSGDLQTAQNRLSDRIGPETLAKLTEHQRQALLDFTFNAGAGKSWHIWRDLKAGRLDAVPDDMMQFVHVKSKTIPGLVRRRRDEVALWEEPEGPAQASSPGVGAAGERRSVSAAVAPVRRRPEPPAVASNPAPVKVHTHVKVELVNAPPGTRATVRSGDGPAVGYAMAGGGL